MRQRERSHDRVTRIGDNGDVHRTRNEIDRRRRSCSMAHPSLYAECMNQESTLQPYTNPASSRKIVCISYLHEWKVVTASLPQPCKSEKQSTVQLPMTLNSPSFSFPAPTSLLASSPHTLPTSSAIFIPPSLPAKAAISSASILAMTTSTSLST